MAALGNQVASQTVKDVVRTLAALVSVALLGGACAAPGDAVRESSPRRAPSPAGQATAGDTRPPVVEARASCVETYTPGAVAGRGFAFDGTVVRVGTGQTDRAGTGQLNYAGVTFAVSEWFVGGSAASVIVDMPPPGEHTATVELPPSYQIGSRLLVSGEPRWGGAPLEDAIAWGCGFTRSYDADTAAEWLAATS